MSKLSSPVTKEELELARNILNRVEAKGIPPSSLNLLETPAMEAPGAMTDGSKRLRGYAPEPEERGSKTEAYGFELVSGQASTVVKENKDSKPVSKSVAVISKAVSLPEGIPSVAMWGKCVCKLPKVKKEAPTYEEIATWEKYASYRKWVYEHGTSMGARCADLRNYLIAVGYYPADSEVVIPGTSETRVFRLT